MKKSLQHYFFALDLVWKSSRKWTIARLFVIFFQAILPLISLYLMKLIIDEVSNGEGIESRVFDSVLYYLLMFGVIALLNTLVSSISQLVNEAQQQRVSDYMAEIIQKQALRLDLSYYENPKYHNTYFQAQRQALHRPTQILTSLTELLQNVVSLALIAGFIAFLNVGMALVLIVSVLPSLLVRIKFSRRLYEWEKSRTSLERESHYLNQVITTDSYVKEMRVFNAGEELSSKFVKIRALLFGEKLKINKFRAQMSLGAKTVEVAAEVGTYIFITYRTFQGLITIGDLVIYFQAFQKGKGNLTSTLQALASLMENRRFLTYIFEFLGLESRVKDPVEPQQFPVEITDGLALKDISFKYPGMDKMVLEHVSLEMKKGEITAIVGENGSGKSSLIKLICRLYDPVKGSVLIDGVDIRSYDTVAYTRRISATFQDYAHYYFSVLQNISISDVEKEVTQTAIQHAAHQTGADAFIDNLPENFEQKLGKQFRSGTELSIGQWQKIALSRAFYRDTEILIVDEPTSAIDPLAEHTIFQELKKMAQDKIVILVTHRLYNLKMADNIVVLDNGKVRESGSHEDLINQNGQYRRMFEKQN